jgi:hypothetical protein
MKTLSVKPAKGGMQSNKQTPAFDVQRKAKANPKRAKYPYLQILPRVRH